MILPDSLIRDFVRASKSEPPKESGKAMFGTVVSVSDRIAQVRIDGAEVTTPATMTMDAAVGDRVSLFIKDHEAIIDGNITSPASARTATNYMRFTNNGLIVGSLDSNGNPSGTYALISSDGYYIKNQNGDTLASFTESGTDIYDEDGNVVASFTADEASLANGKGIMRVIDTILYLLGENGVGVRTDYTDSGILYRAEAVASAHSTSPYAAIQVRKDDGNDSTIASVIAGLNGVDISVPTGKAARVNGNEILTAASNFLVYGVVNFENGTISAGVEKDFIATATKVPSGYKIVGINNVFIDSPSTEKVAIKGYLVDPDTNEIVIRLMNAGTVSTSITLQVVWFAFRSGQSSAAEPQYVDLDSVSS